MKRTTKEWVGPHRTLLPYFLGDRSQLWLAKITGVSNGNINRYMYGQHIPGTEAAFRIAAALRTDPTAIWPDIEKAVHEVRDRLQENSE